MMTFHIKLSWVQNHCVLDSIKYMDLLKSNDGIRYLISYDYKRYNRIIRYLILYDYKR